LLNRKEKYLVMVLQYKPKIFNAIIIKNNPDFMTLEEEKQKHFENLHRNRMKWSRCEKSWIIHARIFCGRFFGFKFNIDRFQDLIINSRGKYLGFWKSYQFL
jgi:hypothetical protein